MVIVAGGRRSGFPHSASVQFIMQVDRRATNQMHVVCGIIADAAKIIEPDRKRVE